jgi:hypothetical protein
MNIYKSQINMQNFGSALLIILRGKLQDVNETFNSLYNLSGTNGDIDISENGSDTVGVFWTNESLLQRYWLNRFASENQHLTSTQIYGYEVDGQSEDEYNVTNLDVIKYIERKLSEMRENAEAFMTFDNRYMPVEHGVGKISAESPDLSFREAAHAHIAKVQE